MKLSDGVAQAWQFREFQVDGEMFNSFPLDGIIHWTFYVYPTDLAFTKDLSRCCAQTGELSARLFGDGTGKLKLHDSDDVLVTTSTDSLLVNQWNLIDVYITMSDPGAWALSINGVSQGSGSADFLNSGGDVVLQIGDSTAGATDIYIDDLVIRTDTTSTFGKVVQLHPTGNGNYTAFVAGTGSGGFEEVDEWSSQAAQDVDTSYVTSSAANAKESCALTDSAAAGIGSTDTIHAVKGLAVCRDENQIVAWRIGLRTNSTDAYLTASDVTSGTTYSTRQYVSETAIDGGAWTTAKVNATEVIIDRTQSQARALRLTALGAMVLFTPAVVAFKPRAFVVNQAVQRAASY